MSVVLLSGGADSTICLHWALANKGRVLSLGVEYKQRHWVELAAAKRIAKRAGVEHDTVTMGGQGVGLRSALTSKRGDDILDARACVVPGRNLLLLTLAAAHAVANGESEIIIGACLEDQEGFPDCRRPFLDAAETALSLALDTPITITAPLLHRSKSDSILLARQLGDGCWEGLRRSWTCYDPQRSRGNLRYFKPCGVCPSCLRRSDGFYLAGEDDPAKGRECIS